MSLEELMDVPVSVAMPSRPQTARETPGVVTVITREEIEALAKAGASVSMSPYTELRIGFGLPSGGGVLYADSVTLKSALEARRRYG